MVLTPECKQIVEDNYREDQCQRPQVSSTSRQKNKSRCDCRKCFTGYGWQWRHKIGVWGSLTHSCFVFRSNCVIQCRLTEIIKMGQAIFPAIDGTFTFCLYCVGPFNIIKGLIISVVVFIIYKPLSRLISTSSRCPFFTKRKKQTV